MPLAAADNKPRNPRPWAPNALIKPETFILALFDQVP
jgi:hypothetical protein